MTDMEFAAGPGVTVKTLYLKRRVEEEESRAGSPSYLRVSIWLQRISVL